MCAAILSSRLDGVHYFVFRSRRFKTVTKVASLSRLDLLSITRFTEGGRGCLYPRLIFETTHPILKIQTAFDGSGNSSMDNKIDVRITSHVGSK